MSTAVEPELTSDERRKLAFLLLRAIEKQEPLDYLAAYREDHLMKVKKKKTGKTDKGIATPASL